MSVSDNFNRANGALGSNWANSGSTTMPVIASNVAIGGDGGDYNGAHWVGNSFNATQDCQITKGNSTNYAGPGVRHSTGGNFYGYFSHGSLQKWVGGSISILGSPASFSTAGDVAKIAISGTTITCYKGGVPDAGGTVTDSSLSTGAAGIVFYVNTGSVDDWIATGEIAAGATSRPVFRRATRFFTRRF